MLELDIPLQSPSSFSQGGGLYRCRTFPGLKDLLQENSRHVDDEDEDEEGYWSSLQDTDSSQTHGDQGSMPSPGLLMSSSSSWESWKGSNDLGLEDVEKDSLASSPGILLSSDDLWRNNRENEERNKCWMEGISRHRTSTFSCLNNGGARSFRKELEDCSDEDSDDEDDEDISLHCYILPSGSKSSFYFVKRSLEAIPEEDESQESSDDEQSEGPNQNLELETNQSELDSNNNNDLIPTGLEMETSNTVDTESETVVVKCNMNNNDEKYNSLSLLEELSHQDINDMYCVLSYMPQSDCECNLCQHTFRVSSPPVCETGSKGSSFNNTVTKRRLSNPLGSPIPSGFSSFRPRCAKVYPADDDDTTCMNAWVYQDDVNRTNDKTATCDSETIEIIDDNTYIGSTKINNSNKHKSSAKSKRKHTKNSRGYSFLHRIWKSFRRKILILETV